MARMAHRSLTPSGTRPSDPLGAGVGGFANSLNAALIRNQQNKQAQDMAGNKQKSALELAMEKFYNQQNLARDPKKVAPATNPKSPQASAKANEQFWDWNNLDDSFKKNPKLGSKYLKDADNSYKGIKDGIRKDPSNIGMDETTVSKQAIASLQQSNPQYFNILTHHVSNALGGGKQASSPSPQNPLSNVGGQGVTFQPSEVPSWDK